MAKSQIYKIRADVHNAMTLAFNQKALFSPLLRMEWKKSGFIPVSAFNQNQTQTA
jgi:hypothetical protein